MNWLRLYTTVLDNPKLQRLSADRFKTVINLWCLARIHDGTLPDVSDVAFRLRCTQDEAAALIADLLDKKLLDKTPKGLVPHDWNEHQYASDSSTERVQNFRKRQKKQAQKQHETFPQRSSNVIEQNRADTEQNRTEQTPTVRAVLSAIKPEIERLIGEASERMYFKHPKKRNMVLVPEALEKAMSKESDPVAKIPEVESVHAAWCETPDWKKENGKFAPKLDEWIADRGFTQWPDGKEPKKKLNISSNPPSFLEPLKLDPNERW